METFFFRLVLGTAGSAYMCLLGSGLNKAVGKYTTDRGAMGYSKILIETVGFQIRDHLFRPNTLSLTGAQS